MGCSRCAAKRRAAAAKQAAAAVSRPRVNATLVGGASTKLVAPVPQKPGGGKS